MNGRCSVLASAIGVRTLNTGRAFSSDAQGASPEELSGKLILDAGCGSGLVSMEMAKSFGMEVVALDLAFGIENAYKTNTNPYVYYLQGSVLNLPFRRQIFDRCIVRGCCRLP